MMENYVARKEIGDYRITIYYDDSPSNPMKDWDLVGCYLFEYDRLHRLSDLCNWEEVWGKHSDCNHSMEETLRAMVKEYCDFDLFVRYIKSQDVEDVRLCYDRSTRLWKLEVYGYWAFYKEWDLVDEYEPKDLSTKDMYLFSNLLEYFGKDTLLELLQHCGKNIYITEWGTTGYSQGDYVNGIVFVTKERYDEQCGRTDISWKDAAQKCIDGEVKCIGKWMWGDVLGFCLEKKVHFTKMYHGCDRPDEEDYEWEEVDSCWGFDMDSDELIAEVMAEHDIKEDIAV